MPMLSYKYRIEPNKAQSAALADMLADFCRLYNACLEQRIDAWRRQISVGYTMQAAELKAVRCGAPELARWSFSAEQQVLRRLDKTFKAFFARGRGFPRFRATARYHAADFRVADGLTIRKSGRIGIVGVAGEIKIRWRRVLPGKPASAILTRQNGQWNIIFHVGVEAVDRAGPDSVGIDLGLPSRARTGPSGLPVRCDVANARSPGASGEVAAERSRLPLWLAFRRALPTSAAIACIRFPAIWSTALAGSRSKI